MATIRFDDDSVVVIIGSGAGGGTLANELCQKGIKVVVLEAGALQIARQLHQRRVEVLHPAGLAGPAHHLGHLAHRQGLRRTCRPGSARRSAAPPRTGPARRCACRSTSSAPARTYGDIEGANLLDWPVTLAELEPYYARAEDKMGVTRTNGIPGLPGNNNFKVMHAGAKKLGYQEVHTGRMAINSQPRDGRGALHADRLLLPGLQERREVVDAVHRDPEGRGHGQPRPAPRVACRAHRT